VSQSDRPDSVRRTTPLDSNAPADEQPDRLARARTLNVVNSLLRHDWVYRWQRILEVAGRDEQPATTNRVAALTNLAVQMAQPGTAIADTLPPFV